MNRPLIVVLAVSCTMLLGLAFAPGLVAAEDIEADRTFNTTSPDPGDTVEVTVTAELVEETEDGVDLAEEIETPFESAALDAVRVDGEEVSPLLEVVEPDGVVIALDPVGPGTVEFVYLVTIPADAEDGSTFDIDGLVQVDGEPSPVGGETTLTVGGDAEAPASFSVSIESAPESATAGDDIDIEYAVENDGDRAGEQDVLFTVDGEEQDRTSVALDGGESTDGTFSYGIDGDASGQLEVAVASEDDEASTTIDVGAANGDDPGVDDSGDDPGMDDNGDDSGMDDNGDDLGMDDGDESDDGFGAGFSLLTALLGLMLVTLVASRRR